MLSAYCVPRHILNTVFTEVNKAKPLPFLSSHSSGIMNWESADHCFESQEA